MSLLDDVSIVVTPNGYKAGELYAVIPVPTEGAEEVTNGDFATDSAWAKAPSGVTISGGSANFNSSTDTYVYQDILTATKTYKIIFSGTINSGSLYIGENGVATNVYTAGTYTNEVAYFKVASSVRFIIRKTGAGTLDATIDNVSVKEYTSADMDVTRSTAATRVDENGLIEDVLSNVPRIDYTGGGCPHILAEPQRTNLVTYSEDFSQWNKLAAIVTTNQTTSPSGTLTADKITYDGTTYGRVEQTVAVTNGNTYSWSVYLKNNDLSDVTQVWLGFSQAGQGEFVTITNEWQRYETVQVANGSNEYPRVQFTGTGSLYVWGAQLEVGSYATSYIPTSGSTVTRNQDQFTRDGIGSLINSTEGVLFAEIASLSNDGTSRALNLSDGTSSNRILIYYGATPNEIIAIYTYGGLTQVSIVDTLSDSTQFIKCAFKFKENDCAFWINGIEVGTDTSTTAFSANTLNTLGFDSGAGGSDFFGKVKQLQVYKTALTDTQLAALTS